MECLPAAAQPEKHHDPDGQGYGGHGGVGGKRGAFRVHAATFEHGRQFEQEQGRCHSAQAVHDTEVAGGPAAAGVAHIVRHQGDQHGADRGDTGRVDHPANEQAGNVPGAAVHENARRDQDKARGGDQAAPDAIRQGSPQSNRDYDDDFAPEIQVAAHHPLAGGIQVQHFGQQEGLGLGYEGGQHDSHVAGQVEGEHVTTEYVAVQVEAEEAPRARCRSSGILCHGSVQLVIVGETTLPGRNRINRPLSRTGVCPGRCSATGRPRCTRQRACSWRWIFP